MIYLGLFAEYNILLGGSLGVQLKHKEEPLTFRRKQSHELNKLLISLKKESEGAVQKLAELMESKDEKIVLQASSKILEFMKDVATEINKDQLQRILLESKNPERGRTLVGDDDDTPLVDFNTVQDV